MSVKNVESLPMSTVRNYDGISLHGKYDYGRVRQLSIQSISVRGEFVHGVVFALQQRELGSDKMGIDEGFAEMARIALSQTLVPGELTLEVTEGFPGDDRPPKNFEEYNWVDLYFPCEEIEYTNIREP